MPLRSNFIKQELTIDFFGKRRFWLGVILGAVYAFILYCFFNLFNMGLHTHMFVQKASYVVSIEAKTQFSHFLFALAGCLMGQFLFFEITLFKNKRLFQENTFKLISFHNIRIAIWYSLFAGFAWFTTLYLLQFNTVFTLFKPFERGWWIYILVPIWLHFYIWNQLAVVAKNTTSLSIKTFVASICIAFLFSQYDPLPYSDHYRNIGRTLPQYALKIDIPNFEENSAATRLIHHRLVNTVFVGNPNNADTSLFAHSGGSTFPIDKLDLVIENFKAHISESQRSRIFYSLIIDEQTKMRDVYLLFNELRNNNQLKISLAALPYGEIHSEDFAYQYINKGILKTFPPRCDEVKKVAAYLKQNPELGIEFLKEIEEENIFCEALSYSVQYSQEANVIEITSDNKILFNEKKIAPSTLFERAKEIIWEEKDKASFLIDVHPNAVYKNYFFVRHEMKRAYNEARNSEALIRHGKVFEFLDKDQQKAIRASYPMFFDELMGEEERFIYHHLKKKR